MSANSKTVCFFVEITFSLGFDGTKESFESFCNGVKSSLGESIIFLCSDLRDTFLKKYDTKNTVILAPPVDLDKFLKIQPDYSGMIRIMRHSSQGDVKYDKGIVEIVKKSHKLKRDSEELFNKSIKLLEYYIEKHAKEEVEIEAL